MHSFQTLLVVLGSVQAVLGGLLPPSSLCRDGTICVGDKSQCTKNNAGWICCAPGEKAVNGACTDGSATTCADGKTVCSGTKPQCTTNSGIFGQGNSICCASGEQAISGKCYPGNKRLLACYEGGLCDLDKEEYCAWTTTGGYSRCCKRNQYLNNGYNCLPKP